MVGLVSAERGVECAFCGHVIQLEDWTCFECWPMAKPEVRSSAESAIRDFQQMILRKRAEAKASNTCKEYRLIEPGLAWDFRDEGEWHCHLCADGGLTPWPPGTSCPNYPCQAFKRPRD